MPSNACVPIFFLLLFLCFDFFCWYPDFPIPTIPVYFILFLLTTFTNKNAPKKKYLDFCCSFECMILFTSSLSLSFWFWIFIQVTRPETNRCILFCRTEFESESGLPQAAWRREGGRRIDQRNGRTARTSASFGRRRRS